MLLYDLIQSQLLHSRCYGRSRPGRLWSSYEASNSSSRRRAQRSAYSLKYGSMIYKIGQHSEALIEEPNTSEIELVYIAVERLYHSLNIYCSCRITTINVVTPSSAALKLVRRPRLNGRYNTLSNHTRELAGTQAADMVGVQYVRLSKRRPV